MARRITLAILLTVWAMLIAGGVVAYVATRSLLLADLDDSFVDEAVARPELMPSKRKRPGSRAAAGDGEPYVRIQHAVDGRTLRADVAPERGFEPQLVRAGFSTSPDGVRLRTVTVRAWARPEAPGGPPVPVEVTYRDSAEAFHRLLDRLALTLGGCVVVGGLVAAALAYRVSKASLRPLRETADVIGSIDEAKLARRIDADALPPELVPMARRLNEMLGRLEQAFASRRQFLADVSHELRTPVAALVTGMEVALARPRSAEGYQAALRNALGDARQLRHLVERLMEQVRSETFAHDEPPREVDVSALLDECADVAASLGEGQAVRVVRQYPPGLRLATQPGRLRSIVQNLVANAVHYNRPGGEVAVRAACNGHGLEVQVRDTGVGIPPEKLPHLFEPFFRGDAAHGSDDGHLGLGLFLVQSHLRALGGRCSVQSEVGRGSTFSLEVPPAQAAA